MLSVIVPAYEAAADLPRCLDALLADDRSEIEILVVDDGSRDGSAEIAARRGVRAIRLPTNRGPGPARNTGARAARGDILVFVDADVAVRAGTLESLQRYLSEHPACAAVFGSYDAEPAAPGLVSRYRNLLHHFVHQGAEARASHFWAGLGAVRREAFESAGGFDEGPYARAIEDIELGYRLRERGYEIHCDKTIRGTHLKRWTLSRMLHTDVYLRAVPWTRLLLSRRALPGDFSLRRSARLSLAAAWLLVASLALAPLRPGLLAVGGLALLSFIVLNRGLLRFLLALGGPWFAAASLGLHLLLALATGFGLAIGVASYVRGAPAERGGPAA